MFFRSKIWNGTVDRESKLMPENPPLEASELGEWRSRIDEANRENVFCHCRNCGYEWVDSFEDVPCLSCASKNVQYILCWQFPDD